jgi:peptide/nickel transport system permease protein
MAAALYQKSAVGYGQMSKGAVRFICKRFAEFAASVALLSFVIFALLYLVPGDPARTLAGVKRVNPAMLESIRAAHHLDEPLLSQFARWLKNALRFDFGASIRTGSPVTEMAAPYLKITLELILLAALFSVPAGIIGGTVSAKYRGKTPDRAIEIFSLIGTSAPSFAVAFMLLYVFALTLGWFPVYGAGAGGFFNRLYHLILPALTLSFLLCAMLVKISRSVLIAEMEKDYGLFLKARGASPRRITSAQLRNASGPILTSTGLLLANLFASTILVETAFAVPGAGSLLASSVTFKDVPVVQFLTLSISCCICLASMLVDIGIFFINPQMRLRMTIRKTARNG